MWLSSKYGFVSVVTSRRNPKEYECRTRNREDAERIGDLLKVEPIHTPKGDYEYRLIITRKKLKKLMLAAADSVDYRNYKATMAPGTKRSHAHHDAWHSFLLLSDKPVFDFHTNIVRRADGYDEYVFDEDRPDPYGSRVQEGEFKDKLSVWDNEKGKWVKPDEE